MQALVLSWEYPPNNVGGLSRHVEKLSVSLVEKGVEVHVITCAVPNTPEEEKIEGVNVYRVNPYSVDNSDFLLWVNQMNFALIERAVRLIQDSIQPFSLIHAHDWLVTYAAKALKSIYKLPLLATIHATEYGRNNGLHTDMQRYISNVEWMLTYEAWKVIVCSQAMREELQGFFQVPKDKLEIINNGVDVSEFENRVTINLADFRKKYADPSEKIIFFIGRLVAEKGVHLLIESIPRILSAHSQIKFIISGKGPMDNALKRRAEELGVVNRIYFTGYVDDEARNNLYKCADLAVFPSLYEPFGIVALEAMAANTPVLVADTGGLGEIVRHGENGIKFYTGNVQSLADNIIFALKRPGLMQDLKHRAALEIREKYAWDIIAGKTKLLYEQMASHAKGNYWTTLNNKYSG